RSTSHSPEREPRRSVRRLSALPSLALGALVLGCAVMARQTPEDAGMLTWTSRALPEARGDFRVLPDGRREAIRYTGWTTRDFSAFRTYDYDDPRPEPVVERARSEEHTAELQARSH